MLLDTVAGLELADTFRFTVVLYYSFSVTEGQDPKSSGVTGTFSSFNLQQNAVRYFEKQKSDYWNFVCQVSDGKKADCTLPTPTSMNANNAGLTQWSLIIL